MPTILFLNKRRAVFGFTLIELLVVIVIIGVLATLATVALGSARAKARDAKRISDVKQMQTALELFYSEENRYPTMGEFIIGQPLIAPTGNKTTMAKLPNNPTPRAESNCPNNDYAYATSTNGYSLSYCLANTVGAVGVGLHNANAGNIDCEYNCVPDSYTKLLLHMDGTDSSTLFADSSMNPKVVTANGNVKVSTTQSKFGSASAVFDGTGDYLSVVNSADFDFGDGDFTVDFWLRFNVVVNNDCLRIVDGSANSKLMLYYYSNSLAIVKDNSFYVTTNRTNTFIPSVNQWYHIAFVRYGSIWSIYVNGALITKDSLSAPIDPMGTIVRLFGGAASRELNGYVDELRVSKGVARWTTNFTPPTAPY